MKMHQLDLKTQMHIMCDICGKSRGGHKKGGRYINHDKCSKIRQQRGFAWDKKNDDESNRETGATAATDGAHGE